MKKFVLYLKMIRLKQWAKNFLVFFPLLIFPHEVNLENFNILITTFLLFCCSSSLVYIVNDWLDKDADSVNKNKLRIVLKQM